jgi:hypothetical protein
VATEGRNYTVPLAVHLLGIALGLYLGFVAMNAIAPDFPDPDVEPGVSSSVAPRAVEGDDPDSLFRAVNLGPALDQLDGQLAAGDGLVSLHITPGSIGSQTGTQEGTIAPADVPAQAPALLAGKISRERGRQIGLGGIASFDLVATGQGPRWYVQLDILHHDPGSPPWTYGAPLDGSPLVAGGAPPKPID